MMARLPACCGLHSDVGRCLCLTLILILFQGCAGLRPRNPLPQHRESQVEVSGLPGVRAWADETSEVFTQFALEAARQERATFGPEVVQTPVVFLALSGGGDDGAFGAGVLCGWTTQGTRPRFKMVTGISTGALIAPFAFLGPDYDHVLRHVYTGVSSRDIFRKKSLLTVLWRESVADTWPLARLLELHVNDEMLAAVAAEHKKGRRLIIGTTQLDAQRLVLWDMGAIASSGLSSAKELFRKIMLASCSIPGAFPPQYIRVQAGGRTYEEMHVDGGTSAQVILYETSLNPAYMVPGLEHLSQGRPRILYLIRNSQIKPEWEAVRPRVGPIAARAISTLIKTQGIGDIYRLYTFSRRDHMDFNLAAIPADYAPTRGSEPFDQVYMNQLFDLGYTMAAQGFPWLKHPPFFDPTPVFQTPGKTYQSLTPIN